MSCRSGKSRAKVIGGRWWQTREVAFVRLVVFVASNGNEFVVVHGGVAQAVVCLGGSQQVDEFQAFLKRFSNSCLPPVFVLWQLS